MTTPPFHPPLHWQRFTALVACWLVAALFVHAQALSTGSVQGRVYNPATKGYVANAEVRLEGSKQIAYTETDGTFQPKILS
jgi:hypothetical protein